ncbi:hypothetical protein [Micromonospora sp. NPDC003816]
MTASARTSAQAAQDPAHRTYAALHRLTERHAATEAQRRRHTNP